ncbi:hypothetical protein DKX38_024284 [Salix brachista]|uniref:DEX1 C-terminal domain-containing protein n=1 Tax=Salix brachista TaxID=2182728 RepID=A0A5N5JS54_9ROSI|nr:hypothetical protein DKX38_024284 [Salix brachista]
MKPPAIRVFLICFLLFTSSIHGEDSNKSKFRDREATDDALGYPDIDEDALLNTQCPRNLELRWQTEVSSSVYATPLIADINSDGKLDVVVPSFVHYLEALEGSDGEKIPGWPAFHQSTVHASPLLYDIDKDGVREIALATYNGEVLFFRVSGYMMTDKLEVPRRRVKKNWYVGLDQDPVDRSHPDVNDDQLVLEATEKKSESQSLKDANGSSSGFEFGSPELKSFSGCRDSDLGMWHHGWKEMNELLSLSIPNATLHSKLTTAPLRDSSTEDVEIIMLSDIFLVMLNAKQKLVGDTAGDTHQHTPETNSSISTSTKNSHPANASIETEKKMSENQTETIIKLSSQVYNSSVGAGSNGTDNAQNGINNTQNGTITVEKETNSAENGTNTGRRLLEDDNSKGSHEGGSESKENDHENVHVATVENEEGLEADADSSFEIFRESDELADEYNYDYDDYVNESMWGDEQWSERKHEMLEDYVNIDSHILCTPVTDINDDGKIELVTTDVHGNVAAWTSQGKNIWEKHLKSLVSQGPTLGDVDGDGHTDVVVPTLSGNIYVLSGKDGSIVRPYPYRTHGRVMNQVLLLDLSKRGEKNKGLTLVTTSFDGYLYLIDGPTSCADVVDIGETSYSMVLADNVDGGDDLDLIVSTMNGNVFCFSTPAWRSTNQGRNNVANRYNREGLYITPSSRSFRDEEGKNFWVEFEIVDKYRMPSGSQAPYNVTTTLLVPGNYQGERQIKQNQIFDRPGKYRIKLPTVGVRTTGTVLVEMVDKNGLYFSDDFSLTFHMHYYKLLKWLLVLPMLGMFGVLVILRPQEAVPLPSFSRNTDL